MKRRAYFLLFLLFFLSATAIAGGPEVKAFKPWTLYVGGFVGYFNADFKYGANYFSIPDVGLNDNQVFNHDAFQQGYSLGGQIGIRYHFKQLPIFVGVAYSAMSDANKANYTMFIANEISPFQAFNINHEFRIQSNTDITGDFGADITANTQVYLKVGGSDAHFLHKLFTTRAQGFPFPIPFLQNTKEDNFWGWVVGLGLIRNFGRWVSWFAEYDHYDYGTRNLNQLDDITPDQLLSTTDHLAQRATITANSVRTGLNFRVVF